ncbi:MAG: XRE family transcriptional regulator [Comamonadaceae bacterium]|nr:XRE family transcriptional regulator [Comamonadaceae bacterium]
MNRTDLPRHDAAFGAAVRARRAVIGITLEQLAEATGISRSALSRIERDELGTSLNYGLAIAQALGCELQELLAAPAATRITQLTRAGEGLRYTDPASGVQRRTLAEPGPGLQWLAYTLPAGATTSRFAAHPAGSCECFHVIQGAVLIEVDGQRLRLGPGDTACLRADAEHHFRNTGRGKARVMLLVAQPRR